MSAVCGVFVLNGESTSEHEIIEMMNALKKHGPDGSHVWHDDYVALGHQMMCITPESLYEELPFHHVESATVVNFEGRVDDRENLCISLGIPRSSDLPDSILILKAYQKWGDSCIDYLIGEFTFVIWDERRKKMICATDPMGVRPFFYAYIPGKYFVFSSEITAILAAKSELSQLNFEKIAMLGISALTGYLAPEKTFFKGINRLKGSAILGVTLNGMEKREYWSPDPKKQIDFATDEECKEAYQEVFREAVNDRLRSAYPVASMLSGGLDSSGVVGMASHILKEKNKRLITLSSVPMSEACGVVSDEREYIELFRDNYNLDMHLVSAEGRGVFDDIDKIVRTKSLFSYNFQHYIYSALIAKAAENNARVVLDGIGGEFTATSYMEGYIGELLLDGKWGVLAREMRRLFTQDKGNHFSTIKREVLRPLIPYFLLKKIKRYADVKNSIRYPINNQFVEDLLGVEIDGISDELSRLNITYPNHRKNLVKLIQQQRDDSRQYIHAGYLDYEKVKLSYPYLDKRVLEFGLSVSARFKYYDGQNRRLFRIGMADMVPDKIATRTTKEPFAPDYHLRFARDRRKASDIISSVASSDLVSRVVDLGLVSQILREEKVYSDRTPRGAYLNSLFTVPWGIFLMKFLYGCEHH